MLEVAFPYVVIFLYGKRENILIFKLADLQLVGLVRALLLHVDTEDTRAQTHTHTKYTHSLVRQLSSFCMITITFFLKKHKAVAKSAA